MNTEVRKKSAHEIFGIRPDLTRVEQDDIDAQYVILCHKYKSNVRKLRKVQAAYAELCAVYDYDHPTEVVSSEVESSETAAACRKEVSCYHQHCVLH